MAMSFVNLGDFLSGINKAERLRLQFMRGEFKRGLQRVRKEFINTNLKGRPGIKAGLLAKGKNVRTYIGGKSEKGLYGDIGISKVLRTHELGETIGPRKGQWIFIHAGKGRGKKKSEIIARVKQVVIPARTHFRALVKSRAPGVVEKVAEEGQRANLVSLANALKH